MFPQQTMRRFARVSRMSLTGAVRRPSHLPKRYLTTTILTRPSIFPKPAVFQCRHSQPGLPFEPTKDSQLDLVPKVSSHPGLENLQIRNGPRDTYNPSHRVRKRRFGFLARLRSRTGRKILMRRKLKRRINLSH